jgi:hypothetical protein
MNATHLVLNPIRIFNHRRPVQPTVRPAIDEENIEPRRIKTGIAKEIPVYLHIVFKDKEHRQFSPHGGQPAFQMRQETREGVRCPFGELKRSLIQELAPLPKARCQFPPVMGVQKRGRKPPLPELVGSMLTPFASALETDHKMIVFADDHL